MSKVRRQAAIKGFPAKASSLTRPLRFIKANHTLSPSIPPMHHHHIFTHREFHSFHSHSTYSQYRVPVSLSRCSQVSTSPLVLSYLIHELANVMNPCAFWPLQISTACTSQHTSHVHSFFATRRIIFKVDPFHTQVLNRSCVTGILWFHSCRRKLREIPRGRWRRASASMWSAGNLQEGSSQSRRVWSVNTNLYTLTDAPT